MCGGVGGCGGGWHADVLPLPELILPPHAAHSLAVSARLEANSLGPRRSRPRRCPHFSPCRISLSDGEALRRPTAHAARLPRTNPPSRQAAITRGRRARAQRPPRRFWLFHSGCGACPRVGPRTQTTRLPGAPTCAEAPPKGFGATTVAGESKGTERTRRTDSPAHPPASVGSRVQSEAKWVPGPRMLGPEVTRWAGLSDRHGGRGGRLGRLMRGALPRIARIRPDRP